MTRRRILLLTPQLPWPLHQGTAIRNYHFARWLAGRHEVTLVSFGPPAGAMDAPDLAPLTALGVHVVSVPAPGRRPLLRRFVDLWTTPIPDLARRLDSAAMRQALASQLSGGFDLVQIEGLEMARHGLWAHEQMARHGRQAHRQSAREDALLVAAIDDPRPGGRDHSLAAAARPRLVYDAHNAEWVLQRRAFEADRGRPRTWPGAGYSWVQTAKLRRFEHQLLGAADVVIAVSRADGAALGQVGRPRELHVVPNGVDAEALRPADPARVDENLVLFVGKMDFRPNVDAMLWFCHEVWPRVTALRPAARLAIVGRDPTARVLALASPRAAEPASVGAGGAAAGRAGRETSERGDARGIEVTGAVPSVTPYLEKAAVVVVPLRVGGGTRLKVLEAMAAGKAIAATTLAVEGLDVAGGRDLILADEPPALAQAITDLLASPNQRQALGQAARRLVEARYGWDKLFDAVNGVYE